MCKKMTTGVLGAVMYPEPKRLRMTPVTVSPCMQCTMVRRITNYTAIHTCLPPEKVPFSRLTLTPPPRARHPQCQARDFKCSGPKKLLGESTEELTFRVDATP